MFLDITVLLITIIRVCDILVFIVLCAVVLPKYFQWMITEDCGNVNCKDYRAYSCVPERLNNIKTSTDNSINIIDNPDDAADVSSYLYSFENNNDLSLSTDPVNAKPNFKNTHSESGLQSYFSENYISCIKNNETDTAPLSNDSCVWENYLRDEVKISQNFIDSDITQQLSALGTNSQLDSDIIDSDIIDSKIIDSDIIDSDSIDSDIIDLDISEQLSASETYSQLQFGSYRNFNSKHKRSISTSKIECNETESYNPISSSIIHNSKHQRSVSSSNSECKENKSYEKIDFHENYNQKPPKSFSNSKIEGKENNLHNEIYFQKNHKSKHTRSISGSKNKYKEKVIDGHSQTDEISKVPIDKSDDEFSITQKYPVTTSKELFIKPHREIIEINENSCMKTSVIKTNATDSDRIIIAPSKISNSLKPVSVQKNIGDEPVNIKVNRGLKTNTCQKKLKSVTSEPYWFHATIAPSAWNIQINGINLSCGKYKQDFSDGDGFYLGPEYQPAEKFARSPRTGPNPCVLVFKLPRKFGHYNGLVLDNQSEWNSIIKYNRCGRDPSLVDIGESLLARYTACDYVYGPVNGGGERGATCKDGDWQDWLPAGYWNDYRQLCIKSEKLAAAFNKNLDSVIIYPSYFDGHTVLLYAQRIPIAKIYSQ